MKVVSDVIPASSVNLPLSVLMENSEEVPKNFTFDLHLEGMRVVSCIEDVLFGSA